MHSPRISPLTALLKKRGFPVYLAKISRVEFAPKQAELLHQEIELAVEKDKEIILIGHSLGGLISRQYAFNYWKQRVIKNVISVGTPHWGADNKSGPLFKSLRLLLGIGKVAGVQTADTLLETSDFLLEDYMSDTFNSEITNIPGIDYLSVNTMESTLHSKKKSRKDKKTNFRTASDPFNPKLSDGLVTVQNSMWTKMLYADKCVYDVDYAREIRGPLYEANHLTQIMPVKAALNLKTNAYLLARDIVDYINETLWTGKYINPPHCSAF